MKCSEKKIVRRRARAYFSAGWGKTVEHFQIDYLARKHRFMSTKYTKRSRIATFGGVCFLTFSDFGNLFGEHLDLISSRYQGPGIRDQGSGIRDQRTGIRDQGTGIRVQGSGYREQETVN